MHLRRKRQRLSHPCALSGDSSVRIFGRLESGFTYAEAGRCRIRWNPAFEENGYQARDRKSGAGGPQRRCREATIIKGGKTVATCRKPVENVTGGMITGIQGNMAGQGRSATTQGGESPPQVMPAAVSCLPNPFSRRFPRFPPDPAGSSPPGPVSSPRPWTGSVPAPPAGGSCGHRGHAGNR